MRKAVVDKSLSVFVPLQGSKAKTKNTRGKKEKVIEITVATLPVINAKSVVSKPKISAKTKAKITNKASVATPVITEKKKKFSLAENLILKYRLKARKLARSILRKWHSRLDIEEVDSIVDLSLCEAVKRFDPKKGASFMTFMFYHLRGNLIRAVATAANTNTIPILDQGSADGEDSASWMNRGVVRGVSSTDVSDALIGGDRELPDAHLLKKEMATLSEGACKKLDELEREVINRIYIKEEQLLDIAEALGYSRCHISRVKRRALESLFDELRGPLDIDKNARPSYEDEDGNVKRRYKVKKARRRREIGGVGGDAGIV